MVLECLINCFCQSHAEGARRWVIPFEEIPASPPFKLLLSKEPDAQAADHGCARVKRTERRRKEMPAAFAPALDTSAPPNRAVCANHARRSRPFIARSRPIIADARTIPARA